MTIDLIFEVFYALMRPEILTILVGGVFAGIIVGALPGLSATMALSLMIPVTFGMPPLPAILLLISIYVGSMFGGAVPAILLHTPGTPSAAATAIDGYQMTLRGEGGKALGIAAIASTIGGIISAAALLFLAPPLAAVSLFFSSPEYFLIAIFGLMLVASVVEGDLIKSLIGAVLGLFLGAVGTDMFSGVPRYTFGVDALQSGIPMVPALIGLFSISQVLTQLSEDSSLKSGTKNGVMGSILPSWSEFKKIRRSIFTGSFLGLGFGILPGAGGEIATWAAYSQAKKSSKEPEMFGKGAMEGVAAPEAANNGVTGGAIIPLLTLGIPANVPTAVLLGGFLIQGLTPGRSLFTTQATLTYSIIVGFILANIVMGVLAIVCARYFRYITRVSFKVIAPIIMGLSVVGAYSINNSIVDVWIMIGFGLFGFWGRKLGIHPAPIILGLLLGPIAEAGLRQSLVLADVADMNMIQLFLSRSGSVGVLVVGTLALVVPPVLSGLKHLRTV